MREAALWIAGYLAIGAGMATILFTSVSSAHARRNLATRLLVTLW